MSRNPHATNLRHHRQQIVPDKREAHAMRCTDELIADARARFDAMSDEAKAEMWRKQRESWVRAFTTPCEHGELDFEQCGECRANV